MAQKKTLNVALLTSTMMMLNFSLSLEMNIRSKNTERIKKLNHDMNKQKDFYLKSDDNNNNNEYNKLIKLNQMNEQG